MAVVVVGGGGVDARTPLVPSTRLIPNVKGWNGYIFQRVSEGDRSVLCGGRLLICRRVLCLVQ